MSKVLNIEDLEGLGGLATETPEKAEIEWFGLNENGERVPQKYEIKVLKLPYKTIEDIAKSEDSVTISLISAGIVFDGDVRLTESQAARLTPDLVSQLIKAFNKVNGTEAKQGDAKQGNA